MGQVHTNKPIPFIDPSKKVLWQAPTKTAQFQSISMTRQGMLEVGLFAGHRVYVTVSEAADFSGVLTAVLYQLHKHISIGPAAAPSREVEVQA